MEQVWFRAALWLMLALVATLLSIWFRIATALSEIVVGTVAQLIIGALIGTQAIGGLATWAGSEAVLPAYIIGMILAGTVGKDHILILRLRSFTFGLLTSFYFICAG